VQRSLVKALHDKGHLVARLPHGLEALASSLARNGRFTDHRPQRKKVITPGSTMPKALSHGLGRARTNPAARSFRWSSTWRASDCVATTNVLFWSAG
jgi:hypothetical protein